MAATVDVMRLDRLPPKKAVPPGASVREGEGCACGSNSA